ncbi:hypothetical protein LSAT2_000352 [Lamellibrachia satsuma]|nr:hypothetical protein LSAT2_000352 [Lamellibrachia satsuma]
MRRGAQTTIRGLKCNGMRRGAQTTTRGLKCSRMRRSAQTTIRGLKCNGMRRGAQTTTRGLKCNRMRRSAQTTIRGLKCNGMRRGAQTTTRGLKCNEMRRGAHITSRGLKCNGMRRGPWFYATTEVELNALTKGGTFLAGHYTPHPVWGLLGITVVIRKRYLRDINSIDVSDFVYLIKLKRNSGRTVLLVVLPLIFINLFTVTQFLLPCNSGEKVTLGMCRSMHLSQLRVLQLHII